MAVLGFFRGGLYIVFRSPILISYVLLILQVTELSPEETESVTGGYGKSISHVIIGLKTVKGTKQLKLDPTIYDALIKEKVSSFSGCVFHYVIYLRNGSHCKIKLTKSIYYIN